MFAERMASTTRTLSGVRSSRHPFPGAPANDATTAVSRSSTSPCQHGPEHLLATSCAPSICPMKEKRTTARAFHDAVGVEDWRGLFSFAPPPLPVGAFAEAARGLAAVSQAGAGPDPH